MLRKSLGSTYDKVLDSDEGNKLISTIGKIFGTTFRNGDGITLRIDV